MHLFLSYGTTVMHSNSVQLSPPDTDERVQHSISSLGYLGVVELRIAPLIPVLEYNILFKPSRNARFCDRVDETCITVIVCNKKSVIPEALKKRHQFFFFFFILPVEKI